MSDQSSQESPVPSLDISKQTVAKHWVMLAVWRLFMAFARRPSRDHHQDTAGARISWRYAFRAEGVNFPLSLFCSVLLNCRQNFFREVLVSVVMNGVFPSPIFSAMDFPPELHEILSLDTEADLEHWQNDKRFDEFLSHICERGLLDPPPVYFDFVEWWNNPNPKKIIVQQCRNSLFGHWHRQNMGTQFILACSKVFSKSRQAAT